MLARRTGSRGLTFSFLDRPWLALATSRAALSWPVLAGTVLLSILTHLFGSGDLGLTEAVYRIFAAGLSALAIFVIIWIANFLRPHNSRAAVVQQLAAFLLAGAARGVALSWLLSLNPEISDGRLDFRLPTSMITMGATVLILTFTYGSYLDHKRAIATLSVETEQLGETLTELAKANSDRDVSEVAAVAKMIVAELGQLELYPKDKQIAEIRRMVNDQVRPLSKKYAENLNQWIPQSSAKQRQSFTQSWLRVDPVSKFPSAWLVVPLSLTPVPATIANHGLLSGLEIFLYTLFALTVSVLLGRQVLRIGISRMKSPWKELAFTLLVFLMAIPGVSATYLALIETPNPHTYTVIGLLAFPSYAWVITLGSSLLADLQNTRAELIQTETKLRWAIARVNLLSWYSRGVVSRLLHGPIQNAMHITLIKMQNSQGKTEVEEAIAELTKRVSEAGLYPAANQTKEDLQRSLNQAIDIWGEVADVELLAGESVLEALVQDSSAAGIVVDLCNEQISNAIRHGEATWVKIHLTAKPSILGISLQHNGKNPAREGRSQGGSPVTAVGLGTRFLENCSIFFETKIDQAGLSLKQIELPLDRQG